jgi:four helix bundle protein
VEEKIGFERLEVWTDARSLSKQIFELTSNSTFRIDFSLREQIRKSCISVVSNIAEGYERDGDKEFHQFLSQAKASAGELRAQLFLCLDLGYIGYEEFSELRRKALSVSRQISGLMKYLRQSEHQGAKYKDQK